MNILIIEDEIATAKDLKYMLKKIRPEITILEIVDSVEESIAWLENNRAPDLIFSDIQLADGLSFEIFETIPSPCPIIFCTAFDEYAIRAFDLHSIGYILKPFNEHKLRACLKQYEEYYKKFDYQQLDFLETLRSIQLNPQSFKSNFLVNKGEKIIPLDANDIGFFFVENGITWIYTFQNKSYSINHTLEKLEEILNPQLFFRANRQFIIAYNLIQAVEPYFSRKLFVHTKIKTSEKIIISKQKAPSFLKWMEGNH